MRRPGKPITTTSDPTLISVVVTVGKGFQRALQQMVTTAKSRMSSCPVTVPVRLPEPSDNRTVTVRDPLITCSFVSIHAFPLRSTRYIQPVPVPDDVRISTTLSRDTSVMRATSKTRGAGVGDGVGVDVGVGVGVGVRVGVAVGTGVGVRVGVGTSVGEGVGVGVLVGVAVGT